MSPYVTREPVDVGRLVAAVADPTRGATVLFLGSVRRSEADGPVVAIAYSAYEEMLASEFARIVEEVAGRWPGVVCAAQQRLGDVPTGEPSIGIAAAGPHRAEAFEACRYVIEEAKRRLPVWKREQFEDGSTRWREE